MFFLSYYTTRVGQNAGWVSLAPLPKGSLFTTYEASYKGFKNLFVKVRALGRASFTLDDKPLPLYWRLPSKFKGLSKGKLSSKDQAVLHLLDELPRGMSCWDLVEASFSHQPIQHLREMLKKR
ncbi:hypothetical protein CR513_05936, partial [Mucuna pruriens]